ncbi:hypothetical protein CkaCkLH20_01609 [Colletotrichum karsti]|uniref:SEC63 domain-containing protein n=1 Tax=Colletotrichum karsti TaxID=1095194 RepID=A0A9P6IDW6_9PEZI|nr:uncharacterized protein CkaCkLH20_01609 [Colletotrichum karsti]KAF9880567.1 hypothetical protein CkaCkLH20_01609 [Colletotrichum karsti]
MPSPGPSQAAQPASQNARKTVDLAPEHQAIMLRYALSPPTIRALVCLPRGAEPNEILRCASSATELRSFNLHAHERGAFSGINSHPTTRWPIKENLSQPWHKAFLIAQCEAAGADYGERLSLMARQDLMATKPKIIRILGQVLRACADIMGTRKDAAGLRRTLETWRAVASKS